MKKVLSLLILLVVFTSCSESIKFNNPAIQALKDNELWRANDFRATIGVNNALTIEGYTQFETLTLNTTSANPGTYILGTTSQANQASYVVTSGTQEIEYVTMPVLGTVQNLTLSAGGSGYSTATAVPTTGGTGAGLKVNIKANASGAVTEVKVNSPGNGYRSGDVITISGGNGNATCVVRNGEIVIEEYDPTNMTVSGFFNFNVVNDSDEVINFQEGRFYKVKIYPSL